MRFYNQTDMKKGLSGFFKLDGPSLIAEETACKRKLSTWRYIVFRDQKRKGTGWGGMVRSEDQPRGSAEYNGLLSQLICCSI